MSSFWGRAAAARLRESFPSSVQEALDNLEMLERSWSYVPSCDSGRLGRIPGERTVKLWSVPPTTGALLHWLAAAPECFRVVELGTSAGYSALWIGQGLVKKPGARLDTWEILEPKVQLAREHVGRAGLAGVVQVHHEDAIHFAESLGSGSNPVVDLIFIDADKENYVPYVKCAASVLRDGGTLVVDNAVDFGGLMIALYEFILASPRWLPVVLDMDNGLLVARHEICAQRGR